MQKISTDLVLNTGEPMPTIGLGTWKSEPEKVAKAVEYALVECGYRHIDCASIYRNESEIGIAFKKVFDEGNVKREEFFVTSKLWNTEHKKEDVRKACEKSLSDLNLKYLDLYLMHWGIAIPPNQIVNGNPLERLDEKLDENGVLINEKISVRETWEAMEELVHLGLVKAIGVANFTAPMLIDLMSYAKIKPAVNQIELHPYLQQAEMIEFCKYNGIVVTAYSPLGSPGKSKAMGYEVPLEDSEIEKIAKNHSKSAAQVLIRWGIQRGTVVIPKSINTERIKGNFDVFDFELSNEDMKKIETLNKNFRFVNPFVWWKIPYFG